MLLFMEVSSTALILLLTLVAPLRNWLNSTVFQETKNYSHDDFNTDKVCNSANPTKVGFVHMYESCYLVTREVFYLTLHWEPQMEAV